jgi:hypothetical protein
LRCLGFQDLVIELRFAYVIHLEIIANESGIGTFARLLTKEEGISRRGLESLSSLERLRSVKFRCVIARWQLTEYGLASPEQVLANSDAVLEDGFQERGRSVSSSAKLVPLSHTILVEDKSYYVLRT